MICKKDYWRVVEAPPYESSWCPLHGFLEEIWRHCCLTASSPVRTDLTIIHEEAWL